MFIKRLIVALLMLAILCPAVTIAAPYSYSGHFAKYLNYDAPRGVYLDTATRVDNWCRTHRDWRNPATGKSCWDPVEVPPVMFFVPQSTVSPMVSAKTVSSPARNQGKVPPVSKLQLAHIANAAADAMSCPTAVTRLGLAFDACGRPTGVFSSSAVKCDALGWVLKKSCDELALTKRYWETAYLVSEILNKEILRLTGRSLVALNDEEGREKVVAALKEVAARLVTS